MPNQRMHLQRPRNRLGHLEESYILGHPVAHSKSPAMYRAAYAALGLSWEYGFADEPTEEDARSLISGREYLSLNVTTPYKGLAFSQADVLGASSKLANGSNLLVNKGGLLLGFNVDGEGAVAFLRREGVLKPGTKAAVCGTGPCALAIYHSLAMAGCSKVLLLSRKASRAQSAVDSYLERFRELLSTAIEMPAAGHERSFREAYDDVEFMFGSYSTSTEAISKADLIVDATTLGMKEGDPAPFDVSLLHEGQAVMDTVYGHGTTRIIKAAKDAGCKSFDGRGMLVAQAVKTLVILTEVCEVDLDLSEEGLFELMSQAL